MRKWIRFAVALLAVSLLMSGAMAENEIVDMSPAVYVAQKNANSVVGVQASIETWTKDNAVSKQVQSQGSGVVVKEGGYILTNYHVIEGCNLFEVLLPSGEYIDAEMVGSDSTLDIAVLRAENEELTVCEIGTVNDLLVGSTAIAIGNPGGDVLANTVTQGIISALERDVQGNNTSRAVNYIQHDAAISSGSSGGGLFDYRGRLVGINTLKYVGSAYSTVTFEGLNFALPVDTVLPLVDEIIRYGKVIRPQCGIYTLDWEGPDEALNTYPPTSVLVADIVKDGPAEKAGVQLYDFVTKVDGERVKNFKELSSILDRHEAGDTVKLTVVRYKNIEEWLNYMYSGQNSMTSMFDMFGGFGGFGGYYMQQPTLNGYQTLEIDVTLEILEDAE